MIYKKINLVLAPVLFIAIYFTLPLYNQWLYTKVLNNNILFELQHMSTHDRNLKRFGYSYAVFSDIKATLARFQDVTLLLPSNGYVAARHVKDLTIPEPAVFYYFTSIRAVAPNSTEAGRANWVLLVKRTGDITVKKMSYVRNPDSLIADYRSYTP